MLGGLRGPSQGSATLDGPHGLNGKDRKTSASLVAQAMYQRPMGKEISAGALHGGGGKGQAGGDHRGRHYRKGRKDTSVRA